MYFEYEDIYKQMQNLWCSIHTGFVLYWITLDLDNVGKSLIQLCTISVGIFSVPQYTVISIFQAVLVYWPHVWKIEAGIKPGPKKEKKKKAGPVFYLNYG